MTGTTRLKKIGKMNFKDFFPRIARSNHINATKASILVYVLLFTIGILIIDFIIVSVGFIPSSFPFIPLILALIGLLIIFRFTNSIAITANLYLGLIFYFLASLTLQSGGLYSIDNFFLYLIPLTGYIFSKARSALFWLIMVNGWSVYLLSLMNNPEQIQLFRTQTLVFPPSYYLLLSSLSSVISFMILTIYYNENQKLIKKLEANQKALKLKNEAYEQQAKQLLNTQKRLKNSNQELEQYAYVTSHDLKQPIRTIHSFADLLKKDLEKKDMLDEENGQFLNLILKSSTNMLRLVTDLLAYAKLTAVKDIPFQKLALDEVLDNVLTDLKNQIDTNDVQIERTQLPTLEVVPIKINQIFQNIISNAIKFKKKTEPLTIKIHSIKKERYWELGIEDNGIGIDPKHQEKIFAPFKKLHSQTEYAGSGIGLATCKRIIELHKGQIWVESEKGKGTKFIFTLPLSKAN